MNTPLPIPRNTEEAQALLERGTELLEQDPPAGVECLRAAAEFGLADAQKLLGHCYDFGWGADEDQTQALHWYLKAAQQGDADAQSNLAILYRDGSLPDNVNQMHHWRQQAAENGDTSTQIWLAHCYLAGQEAVYTSTPASEEGAPQQEVEHILPWPKDIDEAMRWYRTAAELGDGFAFNGIRQCCDAKPELAEEAFRFTLDYAQQHPDSSDAALALARFYWDGVGVETSLPTALQWYQRAAENGNPDALRELSERP